MSSRWVINVDTRDLVPFILYNEGKPTEKQIRKLVIKELMDTVKIKINRFHKDELDMIDCINIHQTDEDFDDDDD
jgi:uncharacterized protein YhaN